MARFSHLFLAGPDLIRRFSSPRRGGDSPRLLARDRAGHAAHVIQEFQQAWTAADQAATTDDRTGVYLDFYSEPGCDLVSKSLEFRKSGIRLLNISTDGEGDNAVTRATVFVPRSKSAHFLRKITKYAEELHARGGKPKNQKLVESIAAVRASVVESFWQDQPAFLPTNNPDWVEVWLSTADLDAIAGFRQQCDVLNLEIKDGQLNFPERTVMLVRANRAQLAAMLEGSDAIAEFRASYAVASFFIEQEPMDQATEVAGLVARTQVVNPDGVSVLILDHGVNNGHALLEPLLHNADRHTVNGAWGTDDHDGHGTRMAGTAAYGDLLSLLNTPGPIRLTHRLESSKILPPGQQQNAKELWGHLTARGVSYAEIQAPARKRIVCMAVTAQEASQRGRPTAWSGQIDELASGASDDVRRLFIVSAGNVRTVEEWRAYPDANLAREVEDPAQAWNALSVGACTSKVALTDPTMAGWAVIAEAGALSPFSTTSFTWAPRRWPIKPEVLFEGGNVARGPNDSMLDHSDLSLLSTYHLPHEAQFVQFGMTSAASALAAWLAARLQATYPAAWPETVRALIVHSAEWTPRQRAAFLTQESKSGYARLARICGYGTPNAERAFYCAENSLTLIAQSELQPFDRNDSDGRYVSRDMHLYRLPWPTDVLAGLGAQPVQLRATLSYFIEPSPGGVGWKDRYRYASHGLRFELNGAGESENEFVARVNRLARDDDEHPGTEGPGDRWTIGEARNVGSIHSDIWIGTAIDLSTSHLMAIYPTVGWWRERQHLGKWDKATRYSLVVSIHLPVQNVDIYTPVSIQLGVPVPVVIPVG